MSKRNLKWFFVVFATGMSLLSVRSALQAQQASSQGDIQTALDREIIGRRWAMQDFQDYLEPRVPQMHAYARAADWMDEATRMRKDILNQIVFRGKAEEWRDAPTRVEWLETVPAGPEYHLWKLRYEALPGMWIPALLYLPKNLVGKVPVVLNVNGHDGNGKAATYKQVRCINLAKRGILALNVEWFGMGQLRTPNHSHAKMNQLDLCGASGMAPFYLNMKRGLDILLSLEHADSTRVAVTGLSGGGWQTIFFSALDTRVTLTNPVAGYSSFKTRVRRLKDLGDSEQTPCDLATVADYTHLTAMMAPRATLLTYNSKDDCCFESGYALPPLMEAASPCFKLLGRPNALRSHVNDDPGTHNYLQDNRQAFYRMIGDHFFGGQGFDANEIPCDSEVKKAEELNVELPASNESFHSLAVKLSEQLPRRPEMETPPTRRWQMERRNVLSKLVRPREYVAHGFKTNEENRNGLKITQWRFKLEGDWNVPAVEFSRGTPAGTTIIVADRGRTSVASEVAKLLAAGQRVLAVDLFYFGESKMAERDYLWALLLAAVGERPLGLQASQLNAIARWAHDEYGPVIVRAIGPRNSVIAMVATALEEDAITRLELFGCMKSLKEIINQNRSVNELPELFCHGLLENFDIKQLAGLASPRPVVFADMNAPTRAQSPPSRAAEVSCSAQDESGCGHFEEPREHGQPFGR